MTTTTRILLAGILACTVVVVFSQRRKEKDTSTFINQPHRVEFNIATSDVDHTLINGEDSGLLLAVETDNRAKTGYNWVFHYMDTFLNVQWTRIIEVPFEAYLRGYEYHNGKFYLLFNTSRYRTEDLLLYEVNAETSHFEKIEVNTVFPIELTHFEVIGHSALLAGYTNYRPVLLRFDLYEKKPQVVPGFYGNNSDILDIIIDDEANVFTVLQSERQPNKRYTVTAKSYTSTADLIQKNVIEPGDKRNLVDGASTVFKGGFQYIAGSFSKKPSQYSRGLYLSKFVNGRQQFVKYYNYADLDNFFSYMNERRERRVKERIERKRAKGKKIKLSYRLLVHDIIQRGDEYVMIAEAYYPKYSNSNLSPYAYGGTFARNNPSFSGYKYTHAIVVSFDRNGNIIWDNSFEIDAVETFSLEKFVTVGVYDDRIVLLYLDDNTIRSKVIHGNEIIEGKTFNPVRLAFVDDEVKNRNPDVEGLKLWYDKTMYAYGEQDIRNEHGTGGKVNREIFYINKIQYHLNQDPN